MGQSEQADNAELIDSNSATQPCYSQPQCRPQTFT